VKRGTRALGVAQSTRESDSYLAGAVVRASRIADGFVFGQCTVGGADATAAICTLYDRLDREDVQYLLIAGIAPAWFNIIDLRAIADHTGLPTISVSFEDSPGLEAAIREAFDDPATVEDRLATYDAQPDRREVAVTDGTVFVRAVGIDHDEAADVVRAYTPEGGRPEPLRVARLAARAHADADADAT
jgi:endonuclease V-like protein UPF0215 family